MVRAQDISVVVQGAVNKKLTPICLKSIRTYLPGAEIVLSTWEGTDVSGLDYDTLILNKDPGSNGYVRIFPHKQISNLNRQLISTQEGLRQSKNPYCMKLRSDMELCSDGFLQYYNLFANVRGEKSHFHSRIMVEGLTTCWDHAFCIGDWWTFGEKEDLLAFYDAPLSAEKSGDIFFYSTPGNPKSTEEEEEEEPFELRKSKPFLWDTVCQYPPEQYIAYHFLRKHHEIRYDSYLDDTTPNKLLTNTFIANDLICIENELSGVYLKKAENVCREQARYFALPLIKWYEKASKYLDFPVLPNANELEKQQNAAESRYLKERTYYDAMQNADIIGNYWGCKDVVKREAVPEVTQEDITFVVSGRIDTNGEYSTTKCLTSIRTYFPKSTILLSIWDNEDVSELEGLYDELVFSSTRDVEMKYSAVLPPDFKLDTVNGQQHCVHNGLLHVKTQYAVRMRTDFCLKGGNILPFYNRWNKTLNYVDPAYTLFEQRILTMSVVTRDSRLCRGEFLYQMSDLFQLGRTSDLLKLWTGVQLGREELNYFVDHKTTEFRNPCNFNHRQTVEQYFLMNCIKNAGLDVVLPEYYLDCPSENMVHECEKVFACNIVCASQKELELDSKFDETCPPFDDPVFLRLNRVLEMYLFNLDPYNTEVRAFLREQYATLSLVVYSKIRRCKSVYMLCKRLRAWMKKCWFALSPVARNFLCLRNQNEMSMNAINHLTSQVTYLRNQLEETQKQLEALESVLTTKEAGEDDDG